jgi:hypothetical protein
MRTVVLIVASLAAGASACRRGGEGPPAAPPPAAGAALALPDALAGFAASPVVTGGEYVRRTYTRGATRIDVTLARAPLGDAGFDGWLSLSRQGFPQAALDAPAEDANGFYQCTDVPQPSCDLLIQLRSGVHLELRGGGTSGRADVDALARGLPLRAWAVRGSRARR